MAKLEKISGIVRVNVDGSVGLNGVNSKDDVVAVQALLKYAMAERPHWNKLTFPEPNGVVDRITLSFIRRFQKHARSIAGGGVAIDGRIDPAIGERAFGRRGMWTMVMLNIYALETWFYMGSKNSNYIRDIRLRFPAFNAAIGSDGVGSLDLELEPSVAGIGTLGLSLE